MRLNVPFLPLAVTIERRPFRPVPTLRGLMVVVLVLAVYLAVVTLPDRRARFARADREVRERMSPLLRAAEEDRTVEMDLRTQYEKDIACAEAEDAEAAKYPPASEEAQSHRTIAGLWRQAARRVPLSTAGESGQRAKAIGAYVAALEKALSESGGSLARIEGLARDLRNPPTSKEWVRLGIEDRIAKLQAKIQAERRDEMIRSIAASGSEP